MRIQNISIIYQKKKPTLIFKTVKGDKNSKVYKFPKSNRQIGLILSKRTRDSEADLLFCICLIFFI